MLQSVNVAMTDGGGSVARAVSNTAFSTIASGVDAATGVMVNIEELCNQGQTLIDKSSTNESSMYAVKQQADLISKDWQDATGDDFVAGYDNWIGGYMPLNTYMKQVGQYMVNESEKFKGYLQAVVNQIED